MKKKKIIIYVYNSFEDPLLQSNLYQYLIDNGQSGKYEMLLITYEQKEYYINPERKSVIKKDLAALGIYWRPLTWHSGSFKLIKKAYDLFLGTALIFFYRFFAGYSRLISLGTVAGSFAHLISRWFFMRHFLYQYEPHSEFLLDCGVWSKESKAYRLLNYLERRAGMKSAILATGTHYMIQRLEEWKSPAAVYCVPSCVNETLFSFDAEKRLKIRSELGLSATEKVFIYIGKFGDIYYPPKTVAMVFKQFYDYNPTLFRFMILSPQDNDLIKSTFIAAGIPPEKLYVSKVPFAEVPGYLSAADFGLVAVPPKPSQRFRSPIKVGEYLCCGLPYIVCRGVSEDDIWAEKENVGVVVSDFTATEMQAAVPKMLTILEEDKNTLYVRCRQAGIAYRGLSVLKLSVREIFEKL